MLRCPERAGWPQLPRMVGLVMALAMPACQPPTPPAEIPRRLADLGQPNLVLIVVDTLRADFTTPYGFEADTSPELGRWAARGVLFEHARSQSSWTKISVASLLTSLWPASHGIRDAQDGLGDAAVTVSEVLRDAGYATYGVQTNGWLHQSFGFHQGFDRYRFPMGGGDPRLGQPSLWPHADRVVEQASELLERHDRARPFFLYLHFMDVHEFAAPPEFKHFGTDSKGAYLAAVRWVDDAVKRVRERLAELGHLERTVLIFTADHGETFGEHGVHGHARNVLTPVVWVPLVFRFPFPLEPLRVPAQVRSVDVAPTILELVGAPIPARFEGESLVPLMTGAARPADRPSVAALGVPLFRDASVQTAFSDGAWTYARNAAGPEEDPEAFEWRGAEPGAELLFDRSIDPGENVNLVTREPDMTLRLRAELDRHLAKAMPGVVEKGVRIDPAIADRLRAMGYLRGPGEPPRGRRDGS